MLSLVYNTPWRKITQQDPPQTSYKHPVPGKQSDYWGIQSNISLGIGH